MLFRPAERGGFAGGREWAGRGSRVAGKLPGGAGNGMDKKVESGLKPV